MRSFTRSPVVSLCIPLQVISLLSASSPTIGMAQTGRFPDTWHQVESRLISPLGTPLFVYVDTSSIQKTSDTTTAVWVRVYLEPSPHSAGEGQLTLREVDCTGARARIITPISPLEDSKARKADGPWRPQTPIEKVVCRYFARPRSP